MNDQEQSDPILKDDLKQQNSIDSNGSDSSSSQVKIVLIKDKNDDSNNEINNDNIVNEQRESVIVQPTRPNIIAETTAKKPKIDNKDETEIQITKDERPKFFIESKFSPSVINNLVNAVTKETNTKLRPSVLRIGDSSSTNDDKNIDSTNKDEQIKVQPFKFAPLTDNKKLSFGNLNSGSIVSCSSILPTNSSLSGLNSSSIFTSSSNSTPTFTTFKNSFLSTNNGDSKAIPTSTNYFTENLFQVASASNNSPESTSTFTISSNKESTGFVFGQNLQDRVTNIVEKPKQTVDLNTSTINQTDLTSNIPSTSTLSTTLNNQTASACIPEKRKFENITGEEEETNVIHIYCKLFHWDSNLSVWKERGKGNLRLNDKYEEERTSSRLIMRTAGSLKLILNCLIQSGMKFELTNENSCIRFSNVDGIYLIKGKPMDIEQIYPLIEQRLKQLPKKSRAESKDVEDGLEIKERLKLDKDDESLNESLNTSNTSNREAEESFKSTESTNKEEDKDDKEDKDDEDNDDDEEENKDDDDDKEEEKAKNNNDENENEGANDENKEIKSNEETVKEKIEIDAENKEINKQEVDSKKSDETNQES